VHLLDLFGLVDYEAFPNIGVSHSLFQLLHMANSHLVLWGGEATNRRGDSWEDFIMERDLRIENRKDSLHTFENKQGRQSHIDITLTLTKRAELTKWTVHDRPMMRDHWEINFEVLLEARRVVRTGSGGV
jgi:hypothetical protein